MDKRDFLKSLVSTFIVAPFLKVDAYLYTSGAKEFYEMRTGEAFGNSGTIVKCSGCGRNGLLPYESNVKLQHTIYHMDSRDRGDYYFVDYCAFDGEGGWEPNSHMAYVHHRNSDGLKIWEIKLAID